MNRRARLVEILLVLLMSAAALTAQQRGSSATAPAVDDLISLKRVGAPSISPDGKSAAYTVRETNWEENSYETEIWLAEAPTGAKRQLTNALKSSSNPVWSPDSRRLAFLSDRAGKRQIYLIDPQGGEAVKLTASEEGISALACPRWKIHRLRKRMLNRVVERTRKKYGSSKSSIRTIG